MCSYGLQICDFSWIISVMKSLYLSIYFWLCRIFVAACGLSLVVASGDYSLGVVCGLLIVASLVQQDL